MTQAPCRSIRFRGRSFEALALEPEAPLSAWIDRLDVYLANFPAFFSCKPIVIDVSNLELDRPGAAELVKNLTGRGIRIMGLAGADPAWSSEDFPPILPRGRATATANRTNVDSATDAGGAANGLNANEQAAFLEIAEALATEGRLTPVAASESPMRASLAAPLVVNAPVRSGQTIQYLEGDVTIVGSVASGADVIAGGSIHIYGALRGRAFAGAEGAAQARIFCRRLEAELLAVGGVYLTADEIGTSVRGQAVQAWLEQDSIRIARLD
ncbi:MAG TPA: septum site-determining protein MinC [Methylocystis sp.]|nr:septum site-determining protein MinC [Methylocystis sp.]